jgi:hypothetical protein
VTLCAEHLAGHAGLTDQLFARLGVEAEEAGGGEVVHDREPLDAIECAERARLVAHGAGEGRLARERVRTLRHDLEAAARGGGDAVVGGALAEAEGVPPGAGRVVREPPLMEVVPGEAMAGVAPRRRRGGDAEEGEDEQRDLLCFHHFSFLSSAESLA